MAAYRDPAWRARACEELAGRSGALPVNFDSLTVAESASHPELVGRRVVDIAAERGESRRSTSCSTSRSTRSSRRASRACSRTTIPRRSPTLLPEDTVLLGLADSGAHVSQLCDACFATDLLGNWVRDKEVMPLEHAIHKLTGEPAARVRARTTAARSKSGKAADVVVFDFDTIAPGPLRRIRDFPADGERLVADRPEGVRHVVVNGTVIREDGTPDADVPRAAAGHACCGPEHYGGLLRLRLPPMAGTATVAFLFVDLVGSTEILSRIGDDANDEVRTPVHRRAARRGDPHRGCRGQEHGRRHDGRLRAVGCRRGAVRDRDATRRRPAAGRRSAARSYRSASGSRSARRRRKTATGTAHRSSRPPGSSRRPGPARSSPTTSCATSSATAAASIARRSANTSSRASPNRSRAARSRGNPTPACPTSRSPPVSAAARSRSPGAPTSSGSSRARWDSVRAGAGATVVDRG